MFSAIVLTFGPFLILHWLGVKNSLLFGFAIVGAILIILLGFLTGLLMCFFFASPDYFTSYVVPPLWTNIYTDSRPGNGPLGDYLLIPYIFVADIFKIYFHINFTHFHLALAIPEAISIMTVVNYTRFFSRYN